LYNTLIITTCDVSIVHVYNEINTSLERMKIK